MQGQKYSTTIAIDTERSVFHFYSLIEGEKTTVAHQKKSFAGGQLDNDFFEKFKDAVREFAENNPTQRVRRVSVVLPDSAVLTDAIKVPTMSGIGQTKKTLEVTLAGLFRNYKELDLISHSAAQNKQYSTFTIAAVQKHIVSAIYAACAENKVLVDTLTYAPATSLSAAASLNPKLRNGTYLLLDVKDVYSRFVFVVNGKPVGSYTLPFGLEFLKKPKVTPEDMLFDHSYAELMVINARERARSKKLTVMATIDDISIPLDDDFDEDSFEGGEAAPTSDTESPVAEESGETVDSSDAPGEATPPVGEVPAAPGSKQKIYTRKNPRRLPKFMQREIPDLPEGILAENFRIFVKWALTLIHENTKLTELGRPEVVYVNLPSDVISVLDSANAEAEENGVRFAPMFSGEVAEVFRSNLELYGGLFPKYISSMGKF